MTATKPPANSFFKTVCLKQFVIKAIYFKTIGFKALISLFYLKQLVIFEVPFNAAHGGIGDHVFDPAGIAFGKI